MVKAVLFDLYGTLLEFENDSRPFYQLVCRARNQQAAVKYALTSHNANLSEFADQIGLALQPDLAALQATLEADLKRIQPFLEVMEVLTTLKRHNIKIAVISNLATPYKQPYYSHGFDALVDVSVFSCDCGYAKPQPEIYELALQNLECAPADALMVGDSFRSDVEGPAQLEIQAVHLIRKGQPSSAKQTITSLLEVLSICHIAPK